MRNKVQAPKHSVDDLSDWEFLKTMYELFGVKRCVELIGWAILFEIAGVKDLKAMREDMELRGMSERTAYRAAADFKRLKDALEEKLHRPVTVEEVFGTIKEEVSAKNGSSVVS